MKCRNGVRIDSKGPFPFQDSADWRPLEFDYVSLRVCHIHRRSFALGAISKGCWSSLNTGSVEMAANGLLIKRLYPEAEVIEIFSFLPGSGASGFSEHAAHWHKVEKRVTSP